MFASIMAQMEDKGDSAASFAIVAVIADLRFLGTAQRVASQDVPGADEDVASARKIHPGQRDKHLAISRPISRSSCRLINGCWFSRRDSNRFSHSSRFLQRRNLSITHYFTSHYHPKWELRPIKWKFGRKVNKRS